MIYRLHRIVPLGSGRVHRSLLGCHYSLCLFQLTLCTCNGPLKCFIFYERSLKDTLTLQYFLRVCEVCLLSFHPLVFIVAFEQICNLEEVTLDKLSSKPPALVLGFLLDPSFSCVCLFLELQMITGNLLMHYI